MGCCCNDNPPPGQACGYCRNTSPISDWLVVTISGMSNNGSVYGGTTCNCANFDGTYVMPWGSVMFCRGCIGNQSVNVDQTLCRSVYPFSGVTGCYWAGLFTGCITTGSPPIVFGIDAHIFAQQYIDAGGVQQVRGAINVCLGSYRLYDAGPAIVARYNSYRLWLFDSPVDGYPWNCANLTGNTYTVPQGGTCPAGGQTDPNTNCCNTPASITVSFQA